MLDRPAADGDRTGARSKDRIAIAGIEIERLRFGAGGRPVLYLHPKDGPGDDASFLQALGDAGFDVHAPWLPGFGHSERPDDVRSVRDLACFATAYLRGAAMEGAIVVGASFGGWVAAEMATRDVARIAGFVLIDALGLKFAGREDRDIADFHSLPPDEVQRRSWVDPAAHAPHPDGMTQDVALAAARSEEAFAFYGWRPYMHDPGLGRWLREVSLPVAVIWGAADGIVAPEYGRNYAALFREGRFDLVDGAAHYPTREQPAPTAALVGRVAASL